MDLSKLPKLSDTKSQTPPPPPPPTDAPPPPPARPIDYGIAQPRGIGGDIWISLIIGILLCYLGGTFARFAIDKITHQPFHTTVNWTSGPKAGTEVDYFDLEGHTAWSDMGVFLFGLILLFEAAAKTVLLLSPGQPARIALMLAILLTLVAMLLNGIACALLFGDGITPLLSGFAVAFGGWILFDEWSTLKRTQPRA